MQATSVFDYKAQFIFPEDRFKGIERTGLQKVAHIATNALTDSALFDLMSAGGPKFRSIRVQCKAAMFRTAAHTAPGWKHWIQQLQVSATRFLTLNFLGVAQLNGAHWAMV